MTTTILRTSGTLRSPNATPPIPDWETGLLWDYDANLLAGGNTNVWEWPSNGGSHGLTLTPESAPPVAAYSANTDSIVANFFPQDSTETRKMVSPTFATPAALPMTLFLVMHERGAAGTTDRRYVGSGDARYITQGKWSTRGGVRTPAGLTSADVLPQDKWIILTASLTPTKRWTRVNRGAYTVTPATETANSRMERLTLGGPGSADTSQSLNGWVARHMAYGRYCEPAEAETMIEHLAGLYNITL